MWDYQFKKQQTNVALKKGSYPACITNKTKLSETKTIKVIYLYNYKLKTSEYS